MRPSLSLRTIGLLAFGWSAASAQQTGTLQYDGSSNFSATMQIQEPGTPGCSTFKYSVAPSNTPINTPGDDSGSLPYYFTLPGTGNAQGSAVFHMNVNIELGLFDSAPYGFRFLIDGIPSSLTTIEIISGGFSSGSFGINPEFNGVLRITHRAGDAWGAWGQTGSRHFTLRTLAGGYPIGDIRFFAVMVGTNYTNVMGHFDTPQAPLYILRDPPGDQSYSSLTSGNSTCFGQSYSLSADASLNTWGKVKVGVQGSVGLVATTDYSIYGQVGVDLTVGRSQTSETEYETCLETTSEFSTPIDGPPDDVFIGSAIRYAYGFAKVISRPSCGVVTFTPRFCMVPVNVLSSYNYTESYIRGSVVPTLEQLIDGLPPGSTERRDAENQLDVWNQTLLMNDNIKAGAPLEITRAFNGGGNGQSYSLTKTTSQSSSIEMSVYVDAAINYEFSAEIGGSGVSAGGEVRLRSEFGQGQNSTNTTTNTMSYHLEDDDAEDNLSVQVRSDAVYGTYAFRLDDGVSATSCPYEGGYQIDQPSLSVGTPGTASMVVNEAPIGTAVNFPLIICNNSTDSLTYFLKFSSVSNSEGAVLEAFGNVMNSNDDGVQLDLAAGACFNANLTLTQPNAAVVDIEDIVIYLYSLCEPSIRSSITVSAYFGTGNGGWGVVCMPVHSGESASYGQFIDGVELGTIANTSTGVAPGAAYTDYFGQFSTVLPRNSQQLLRVNNGTDYPELYAAWIDWDQSGTFEESEKLGELANNGSENYTFPFSVPTTATLGTTRMRVRLVEPDGAPVPLLPCYNYYWGETEDYSVVITDDAPLDCQGVLAGGAWPGSACDDGDALTANDAYTTNCACAGVPLDCTGVPNGSTGPGALCDDGDPNTAGDVFDTNCICTGVALDCTGQPGGSALPGTACDDGDLGTGNDVLGTDCVCAGLMMDCIGTPGGTALPGATCDDGDPLSTGDAYTANCVCLGTLVFDCLGVEGGSAQPGTPCDDLDPQTGVDSYGVNCVCAGLALDCNGFPGGPAVPGAPCVDWNPMTINDVISIDCVCLGVLADADCLGVPGGTTQPGTPCDDGDPNTGNDAFDPFCQCQGQLIDCLGVIGGQALPGYLCNDGSDCTINDVWDASCTCMGTPNPVEATITSNLPVCQGTSLYLYGNVTGALPGFTNYSWTGPNGFTYASTQYDYLYLQGADPALVNGSWTLIASNGNCISDVTLFEVFITPDSDGDGLCDALDNCPILTGQQGDNCDDGNPNTVLDVITSDCICVGELSTGIVMPTTPVANIRYDRPNGTILVRDVVDGPVMLFDALGQLLLQGRGPIVEFNVQTLPTGLYFVRASNTNQRVVVVR